jgi:hypothetical protein
MSARRFAEVSDRPPAQFWSLLGQYLDLVSRYDEAMETIEKETKTRIATYFEREQLSTAAAPPGEHEFLRYIDDFVDKLVIYYSFYLATRRSMGTLFASIGVTDPKLFADALREGRDPHVIVRTNELDVDATKWFLEQFLEENQTVAEYRSQLIDALPQLEESVNIVHSRAMRRFLNVLRYVASDGAARVYDAGIEAVKSALDERNLAKQVDLVLHGTASLMTFIHGIPMFILTESAGDFGPAELEEFDEKIRQLKQLRQMFKKHVRLHSRSEWVYERHHRALLTSIFDGSREELVQLMREIRGGADLRRYGGRLRDRHEMLLGVAQGNSLFLEYSAYYDERLHLVGAYKEIADFLQSELLEALYSMEVRRNEAYLGVRDEFKQSLDELQQVLSQVSSLDAKRT